MQLPHEDPEWMPWLNEWVQSLPRFVFVLMMILGGVAGFIYATYTGAVAKQCIFVGAITGFLLLPGAVLLIRMVVGLAVIAGFFLLVYWVFFT